MKNKLLNMLGFAFVFAVIIFATNVDANQSEDIQSTPQNTFVLTDVYETLDFDGGHYYYVRLQHDDSSVAKFAWELTNESEFRKIRDEEWEAGDVIVVIVDGRYPWDTSNNHYLWNETKATGYSFKYVGNWWPQFSH